VLISPTFYEQLFAQISNFLELAVWVQTLLAQGNWQKSCSLNVAEIDYSS
jgi:hypothetical protein